MPVDRWHAIGGVVAEVLGQLRRRCGLHAQVHLQAHLPLEEADHLIGLEAAQLRLAPLDQVGQPGEEFQVALEGGLDAGAQHLDGDRSALGGRREVNLRDRGGGDRLVLEAGEDVRQRLAQLGLDGALGLGGGKGRQAVLQV